jgi:hypothetical protein
MIRKSMPSGFAPMAVHSYHCIASILRPVAPTADRKKGKTGGPQSQQA